MKILHIINNLGSGGAEKLLSETIPLINQEENIHASVLLLTDKNNVFEKALLEKKVKVDVVKYRNMYDLRNVIAIRNYIVKGNYDIVHSHVFPTQYWVSLSKLLIINKNIKFITTEHSITNRRRRRGFRTIEKIIYFNYNSIISITKNGKKNLVDWLQPKDKNLKKHIVIENGIDITKIKEAKAYKKRHLIPGINSEVKLICMVGRFYAAKDQTTIIKAIKLLPNYIHLVLVGEGDLLEQNKQLAKDLGISNRVHFLGFRNDIFRIIKTVDVIVLSSKWEGLSLASIEGLSSGKPFIGSRVPGLEEVISGHGLLFEQGDEDELSKLIEKLIMDQSFYVEVVSRCLRRSEDFKIEVYIQKLLTLYNQ